MKSLIFFGYSLISMVVMTPLFSFAETNELYTLSGFPVSPAQTEALGSGRFDFLINSIFTYSITAAAILAALMLVIYGLRYASSDLIGDRINLRSNMLTVLGGLVILSGAYLILFILNPQLTDLSQLRGQAVQYDLLEPFQLTEVFIDGATTTYMIIPGTDILVPYDPGVPFDPGVVLPEGYVTPIGHVAAAWDGKHTQAAEWSHALYGFIFQYGRDMLQTVPRDYAEFCPAYPTLGAHDRAAFYVGLFSKIAELESSFRPNKGAPETGNLVGVTSRGLLQISIDSSNQAVYGCNTQSEQQLHDPFFNLHCGVKIMNYWIARDQFIASRPGNINKGGGHYWAVLRTKPTRNIHKRASIALFTRSLPVCSQAAI